MEVFVAKRPVFDDQKKLYGYELEFRDGFEDFYDTVDTDKAKVDFLAFVNFVELVGNTRGFIHFSRNLLMQRFPSLLSNESLIVMLDDEQGGDAEVVEACREFNDAGYALLIDDITSGMVSEDLVESISITRVDFATIPAEKRAEICREAALKGVLAMATNVDTAEEFDQAQGWGYSFFEGEFFTKPIIQPGKEMASSKVNYLRVLSEVNKPELEYDELEEYISQDVSMAYALLRFVNSAWYGVRYEIHSIRHTLVMLGPEEVRVWASMLVLRNMAKDKPDELIRLALTRAKVAEGLAPLIGMEPLASELFLMGMFSVIDALTDMPMQSVLDELPLREDIVNALLGMPGKYRSIFDTILSYEKADWENFDSFANELGFDERAVPKIFRDAASWAEGALDTM